MSNLKYIFLFTILQCYTFISVYASINSSLKLYESCKQTTFKLEVENKSEDKLNSTKNTFFISLKRIYNDPNWYSFNINQFDSSQKIFSYFDAESKELMVTQQNGKLQRIDDFNFDAMEQPDYIWELPFLPFNRGYLSNFNGYFKKISLLDNHILYRYQFKKIKITVYINIQTKLIDKYTILDDNNKFIRTYRFNYFSFNTYKHLIPLPAQKHPFIPVELSNKIIYDSLNLKSLQLQTTQKEKNQVILNQLKNKNAKFIILDFWYISCMPCRKNLQVLDSVSKVNTNIEILLVNVHDADIDVIYFKNKYNYSFNNYTDTMGILEKFFLPKSYPTTILLNQNIDELMRSTGDLTEIFKEINK